MLVYGIEIDEVNLPGHVAIIMDGNRRWADSQSISYFEGHKKGILNAMDIVKVASRIGVKFLTLYAFSKENWKRSAGEVSDLFELFSFFYDSKFNQIKDNDIRVVHSGDFEGLSDRVKRIIRVMTESTLLNRGMVLNLAINYSSRFEIMFAIRSMFLDFLSSGLDYSDFYSKVHNISENDFEDYLYNSDIPFPDFLIRTSGEIRVSNFLLWQIAYTELYFTSILWPDFDQTCFLNAIVDYQKRKRRFGGN